MDEAEQFTVDDVRGILRVPSASDDKYTRGVVGFRTGSEAYPGAAVLGVEAAWRTGVGMVRYLGDERPTALVLARRPETVSTAGRVQSWVVGSGTDAADRSSAEEQRLRDILDGDEPVVLDAGALDLVSAGTAPRVITPHARELARVREAAGLPDLPAGADDRAREAAARETVAALGVAVLLKGAVTIVATPGGWVRRVAAGTPWLATAGTGDVLGGVTGAIVAGAAARRTIAVEDLGALAAAAAWLHGRAGFEAARALGPAGGPITALDVADALAGTVAALLGPA